MEVPSGLIRLSDVPCPPEPATLPFTLVVDDQPGHEKLAVVLTTVRADDTELRRLVETKARDRGAWVTAFDFPKDLR